MDILNTPKTVNNNITELPGQA